MCSSGIHTQKFWKDVAEFEMWRTKQDLTLEEATFLIELFIGLWEEFHDQA